MPTALGRSPYALNKPPAGSILDVSALPMVPYFASYFLEQSGVSTWDNANGKKGTFTGATPPSWAPDNLGGNSVKLSGATSQVTFPSTYPHIVPPFTIVAIGTPTSFAAVCGFVAHDSGANNGFRMELDNAGVIGELFFTWGGVADYKFNTLVASLNMINRVAVTVDKQGGTATGYMRTGNGLWQSQSTAIGTEAAATPNRIQIASDNFSGVIGFAGVVSMVAIFPSVLNQQAIYRVLDEPYAALRGPDVYRRYWDFGASASAAGLAALRTLMGWGN